MFARSDDAFMCECTAVTEQVDLETARMWESLSKDVEAAKLAFVDPIGAMIVFVATCRFVY